MICPLCLKIVSSFNEMQLTLSTRPQEGKARGAMRKTLAAKVCLPPGLAARLCLPAVLGLPPSFVCLGWPPSFVCHQAVAATSALRLSQLSSTAEQ